MTEKLKKLWEEIKEYVVTNKDTYELELVKNAPEDIQKKFQEYINMEDDEIIIKDNDNNVLEKK